VVLERAICWLPRFKLLDLRYGHTGRKLAPVLLARAVINFRRLVRNES
jgi:hypothetical protein